jgi:hypothetical protein
MEPVARGFHYHLGAEVTLGYRLKWCSVDVREHGPHTLHILGGTALQVSLVDHDANRCPLLIQVV